MSNFNSQKVLKENGVKSTECRVKILECLADSKHFHTISELQTDSGVVNTKSVYNVIKKFTELGIVDAHSIGGVTKYAINDHYKNEHNVIHVSEADKKIEHIKIDPIVHEIIRKTVEKDGKKMLSVNIIVKVK